MDSIADLAKLHDLLSAHGFTQADTDAIFCGNFVGFFGSVWLE